MKAIVLALLIPAASFGADVKPEPNPPRASTPKAPAPKAATGASGQPRANSTAPSVTIVSLPRTAVAQPGSAQQDKVIEAAIRDKLAKSKIGTDGLTVHVQGGVAYWEGKTNVVQHKGSATRMAKAAGAARVVNNIKVSDAAKQASAANLEQGRRRAQVVRGDARTEATPKK